MTGRIFISAAFSAWTDQVFCRRVRDELAAAGYETALPLDPGVRGREAIEHCDEEISRSDLVLAIVDGHAMDAGVGFQMGLAYARGIPVAILRTNFRARPEPANADPLDIAAVRVAVTSGNPFDTALELVRTFFENRAGQRRNTA